MQKKPLMVGILALIFFLQNAVFLNAAEANFWSERRSATQAVEKQAPAPKPVESPVTILASLPLNVLPAPLASQNHLNIERIAPVGLQRSLAPFASVQAIHVSKKTDAKTIYLFQDAHLHQEAQQNSAGALNAIAMDSERRRETLLVGLEAAPVGRIDLSLFNNFVNRQALAQTAAALTKVHVLNGAEQAALSYAADRKGPINLPMNLMGVENWADYEANVRAFRQAHAQKEKVTAALAESQRELQTKKQSVYNPELARFDRKNSQYEAGTLGISDYALYLDSIIPAHRPNTQELIRTVLIEKSLDFAKVEQQRTRLLETLLHKLSQKETSTLLALSSLMQSGHLSYADFYRHLKTLFVDKGVEMARYPDMGLYIQYVLKSESINATLLLTELRAWENEAAQKLAKTPEQLALIHESRAQQLMGKLAKFELTEEEWKEYEASHANIACACEAFEDFYRIALRRNRSMAEHLARALETGGESSAVLVAGGFHTNGLREELAAKDFHVLTVSPKITKVGEGPSSLEFLASNRTPLDQIFVGERLFLDLPRTLGTQAGQAKVHGNAVAWEKGDRFAGSGTGRPYDIGDAFAAALDKSKDAMKRLESVLITGKGIDWTKRGVRTVISNLALAVKLQSVLGYFQDQRAESLFKKNFELWVELIVDAYKVLLKQVIAPEEILQKLGARTNAEIAQVIRPLLEAVGDFERRYVVGINSNNVSIRQSKMQRILDNVRNQMGLKDKKVVLFLYEDDPIAEMAQIYSVNGSAYRILASVEYLDQHVVSSDRIEAVMTASGMSHDEAITKLYEWYFEEELFEGAWRKETADQQAAHQLWASMNLDDTQKLARLPKSFFELPIGTFSKYLVRTNPTLFTSQAQKISEQPAPVRIVGAVSIRARVESKDGNLKIVGAQDGSIAVFNLAAQPPFKERILRVHKSAVVELKLSQDEDTLISVDTSGVSVLWNLAEPNPTAHFKVPVYSNLADIKDSKVALETSVEFVTPVQLAELMKGDYVSRIEGHYVRSSKVEPMSAEEIRELRAPAPLPQVDANSPPSSVAPRSDIVLLTDTAANIEWLRQQDPRGRYPVSDSRENLGRIDVAYMYYTVNKIIAGIQDKKIEAFIDGEGNRLYAFVPPEDKSLITRTRLLGFLMGFATLGSAAAALTGNTALASALGFSLVGIAISRNHEEEPDWVSRLVKVIKGISKVFQQAAADHENRILINYLSDSADLISRMHQNNKPTDVARVIINFGAASFEVVSKLPNGLRQELQTIVKKIKPEWRDAQAIKDDEKIIPEIKRIFRTEILPALLSMKIWENHHLNKKDLKPFRDLITDSVKNSRLITLPSLEKSLPENEKAERFKHALTTLLNMANTGIDVSPERVGSVAKIYALNEDEKTALAFLFKTEPKKPKGGGMGKIAGMVIALTLLMASSSMGAVTEAVGQAAQAGAAPVMVKAGVHFAGFTFEGFMWALPVALVFILTPYILERNKKNLPNVRAEEGQAVLVTSALVAVGVWFIVSSQMAPYIFSLVMLAPVFRSWDTQDRLRWISPIMASYLWITHPKEDKEGHSLRGMRLAVIGFVMFSVQNYWAGFLPYNALTAFITYPTVVALVYLFIVRDVITQQFKKLNDAALKKMARYVIANEFRRIYREKRISKAIVTSDYWEGVFERAGQPELFYIVVDDVQSAVNAALEAYVPGEKLSVAEFTGRALATLGMTLPSEQRKARSVRSGKADTSVMAALAAISVGAGAVGVENAVSLADVIFNILWDHVAVVGALVVSLLYSGSSKKSTSYDWSIWPKAFGTALLMQVVMSVTGTESYALAFIGAAAIIYGASLLPKIISLLRNNTIPIWVIIAAAIAFAALAGLNNPLFWTLPVGMALYMGKGGDHDPNPEKNEEEEFPEFDLDMPELDKLVSEAEQKRRAGANTTAQIVRGALNNLLIAAIVLMTTASAMAGPGEIVPADPALLQAAKQAGKVLAKDTNPILEMATIFIVVYVSMLAMILIWALIIKNSGKKGEGSQRGNIRSGFVDLPVLGVLSLGGLPIASTFQAIVSNPAIVTVAALVALAVGSIFYRQMRRIRKLHTLQATRARDKAVQSLVDQMADVFVNKKGEVIRLKIIFTPRISIGQEPIRIYEITKNAHPSANVLVTGNILEIVQNFHGNRIQQNAREKGLELTPEQSIRLALQAAIVRVFLEKFHGVNPDLLTDLSNKVLTSEELIAQAHNLLKEHSTPAAAEAADVLDAVAPIKKVVDDLIKKPTALHYGSDLKVETGQPLSQESLRHLLRDNKTSRGFVAQVRALYEGHANNVTLLDRDQLAARVTAVGNVPTLFVVNVPAGMDVPHKTALLTEALAQAKEKQLGLTMTEQEFDRLMPQTSKERLLFLDKTQEDDLRRRTPSKEGLDLRSEINIFMQKVPGVQKVTIFSDPTQAVHVTGMDVSIIPMIPITISIEGELRIYILTSQQA